MKQNTKKILKDIKNSMKSLIKSANDNADCKGFVIIFGNYSINIPSTDTEDFWYELKKIESKYRVRFEINQFNDLCLTTEEYCFF